MQCSHCKRLQRLQLPASFVFDVACKQTLQDCKHISLLALYERIVLHTKLAENASYVILGQYEEIMPLSLL